jgi:hypothetical protein
MWNYQERVWTVSHIYQYSLSSIRRNKVQLLKMSEYRTSSSLTLPQLLNLWQKFYRTFLSSAGATKPKWFFTWTHGRNLRGFTLHLKGFVSNLNGFVFFTLNNFSFHEPQKGSVAKVSTMCSSLKRFGNIPYSFYSAQD